MIFTLHLTMLFWLYLGCLESIFSQISIWSSWDCALQGKWHLFFIYMMGSWSNIWLKVKSPNLQRVMSMEGDYFSKSQFAVFLLSASLLFILDFLPNFNMLQLRLCATKYVTFIFDLDDGIMVKISIEGEKSESVIDFLQIYVWKCRGILVSTPVEIT